MAKADLAGAMADTTKLSTFDGKQVIKTSIAVTNAGDGLSAALAIEPMEMHHGEKGYLLLEYEVVKVTLRPISKDTPDLLDREHTLKAGTATIVGADLAESHIRDQAERIESARRRSKGEFNLDDEAMIVDHDDGQHAAERRPGCPKCDEEVAAEASEKAADAPPAPTSLADRAKKVTGAAKKAAAPK